MPVLHFGTQLRWQRLICINLATTQVIVEVARRISHPHPRQPRSQPDHTQLSRRRIAIVVNVGHRGNETRELRMAVVVAPGFNWPPSRREWIETVLHYICAHMNMGAGDDYLGHG